MDISPKEYILKNWNTSSGKRITEMLNHYQHIFFSRPKEKKEESDIVKIAQEVFK